MTKPTHCWRKSHSHPVCYHSTMHFIKRARLCPLSRYTQPTLTATSSFPPSHQPHDNCYIHSLAPTRKPPPCSSPFPPPTPRNPPLSHLGHPPPSRRAFATDQDPPPPTPYTYQTLAPLTTSPSPHRLIIDVREPAELAETGRIPSALSMPLTSNPDAFHLDGEEFFERFGFERPVPRSKRDDDDDGDRGRGAGGGANPYTEEMKGREASAGLNGRGADAGEGSASRGGGVEEVIFYCKAGVRSRAAARLAGEWKGVKVGDMKGGWMEWSASGGEVER